MHLAPCPTFGILAGAALWFRMESAYTVATAVSDGTEVNRTTNTDQPSRHYSGVARHANKWLAKFRCGGRDVNLGHYEDPELAARVADFARYRCFGLKPANWHVNVGRPNFPPCFRTDFSRVPIFAKLLRLGAVQVDVLRARLAEYDAVAK